MIELDAESLVDQVTMLGLVSREQLREATADAEDGSPDAVLRMLLRKGSLTSWQIDRLKKGDPSGLLLRRRQGALPPRRGDVRPRLSRRARHQQASRWRSRSCASGSPRSPRRSTGSTRRPRPACGSRHPNIVQIIDVGQQDNRHYMIMEYVEGMNLRDFLKLRTRMQATPGAAADARAGPGPEVLARAGRHPPRHQGDQHPDLQHGRRQARRFRPGDHRRGTRTSRASRASAPSTTRRSSAPARAPRATRGPTSTSSAASSTRW